MKGPPYRLFGRDPFYLAPIAAILIGVAIVWVFTLWKAPDPAMKRITDIAGATGPILTFLAVLVAAVGWNEAARLNGEQARLTEKAKQDHARQGTRRQVRTLLRDALASVSPFFYLAPRLQLQDIARAYERFVDRLNERDTAIALLDHEYDALDAFVAQFGRQVALAQMHDAENPEPTAPHAATIEGRENERHRFFSERRYFLAICFDDTLQELGAAISLLGDDDMKKDVALKSKTAKQTIRVLYDRLYGTPSSSSGNIQTSLQDLEGVGEWQAPILDLLRKKLPGSRPTYVPLPNGRTGLVVSWSGFNGSDKKQREDMVLGLIAMLGSGASEAITVVNALSPDESQGLEYDPTGYHL